MLRALLRMETAPPSNYRTSWPYQSLALKDAKPLVPGQWTDLRLALLPTSWTFSEGSRIRVSITGSDCDHYAQVPHGRPPALKVHWGESNGSSVQLPCRIRDVRSEEHTSELQSLMSISYAVFCLKKKKYK